MAKQKQNQDETKPTRNSVTQNEPPLERSGATWLAGSHGDIGYAELLKQQQEEEERSKRRHSGPE